MEADPAFVHAIQSWHDFYVLVGSAAATLTGLMFVAVSFAIGAPTKSSREQVHTYVTPTVTQFLFILVLAALALAPTRRTDVLGALLLGLCLIKLSGTAWVLRNLFAEHRQEGLELRVWITHILIPTGCNLLVLGAAVGLLFHRLVWLELMAIPVLGLLAIGVWSSWNLVVWLLEQRARGERREPTSAAE